MKSKFLLFLLLISSYSQSQIISTVAGNGTYGYSGNGGLATSAQLAWQIGVIADNSGNIFIADHDNDVIRKVNSSGIITNFAGIGIAGYSGDGGLATSAKVYHPSWMGIDNLNNIYFIDQNGGVIRKIDNSTGVVTSITGNLPPGYSGDGGPLIAARFKSITGVSFDFAGNMYITDGNHVIRKVNSSGTISTVAGTGISGFSGDGGPASSAQLSNPYSVAFDITGNMYIPDVGNNRIRKVNPAGIISTYAGTGNFGYSGDGGQAISADLGIVWTIDIDKSGNLYIGDAGVNVVRKVATNGVITTYAGNGIFGNTGDGGLATTAQLGTITCIKLDASDNLFISVREYFNVIKKVSNCLSPSISSQPSNVVLCNSGNASFSATAANYNTITWQVNTGTGWNDVIDNATYSGASTEILTVSGISSVMNGYQYRLRVTNSCTNVYSVAAILKVNIPVALTLTISADTINICQGTLVTFNAIPSFSDTTLSYQWMKNGLITGTNSPTFTFSSFNEGDTVLCILSTTNNCVLSNTSVSNKIKMSVTPVLAPSITISPSLNNVCAGVSINFLATQINGGNNPSFQWIKNGNNTGINSSVYSDSTLKTGDSISCRLTSNYGCPTTSTSLSNSILMTIIPLSTPSVTISTPAHKVCPGAPVTFSAVTQNAANSTIYNWKKNNTIVGSNSSQYTSSSILQGDIISCDISTTGVCLSTLSASSNSISMSLFQNPVVSLEQTSSLCMDSHRQLDAGNFSSYLWNNGSTGRTLLIRGLGTYYVTVKDVNGCNGSDTSKILSILPKPANFLPLDTGICSYGSVTVAGKPGYTSYLWNNFSTASTLTINQSGLYWLEVTDNNNCKGTDSIIVSPKQCMTGFYIPTAFTPNNDGKNDLFKPLIFGNVKKYIFQIYNRYGMVVYQSSDITRGWDGAFKSETQNGNAFIWTCLYEIEGEKPVLKKGTVLIIR